MRFDIAHLKATFAEAERLHPDLMERYAARLAEAATTAEEVEAMRAGLRETFRARYPMPAGVAWPEWATPASEEGQP